MGGAKLLTLLCLFMGSLQLWLEPQSDKLIDVIALGKCEVHYTKSQYSFCTIIAYSNYQIRDSCSNVTQSILSKFIGY